MPSGEFQALLVLLAMLIFNWRTGTLMLLLIVAAVFDCRSHRIPNWLVLAGLLFGVLYNTAFPASPRDNMLFPLAGIGLGLLLFLPLYLLRVMGAGDVKLMAMVGAFLGPDETFYVILASMIVGGVLAVGYVLAKGAAARMLRNFANLFQQSFLSVLAGTAPNLRIEAGQTAGKLPYGVAIALGTSGYLVLHQLGFL